MDTDIIDTRSSSSDRLQRSFGDPDPTDLDRLAASLNDLALYCHEPPDASPQMTSSTTLGR